MNLAFDTKLAEGYTSKSQIIRVLSENWVEKNGYCPSCGHHLKSFDNNKPVADLFCCACSEEFELKSKKAKMSNIVNDGAYDSMIDRITHENNPNFFFLTYSKDLSVNNFLIIPKHFFTPDVIVKRKPLAKTAKRAGWVGCNIDLRNVPESGKVFFVKNREITEQNRVVEQFNQMMFLRQQSQESRGWLLDVLKCVDELPDKFTLKEVYHFTEPLAELHPNNHNVHAKIRQQLQLLRDKGLIEFIGRGVYRKLPSNC